MMNRTQCSAIAPTNNLRLIARTLGIVAGLGILYPSEVVAPSSPYAMALTPDPKIAHLLPARTLTDLYQIRDRLQTKIKQCSNGPTVFLSGNAAESQSCLKTLQAVNARIQLEETAQDHWEKAQRFALQARRIEHLPQRSAATWQQTQTLWQQALNSLHAILPDSFLANRKIKTIQEYKAYLAIAAQEAKLAQSEFLIAIAQQSGLSAQAMITICHSSGACHHLRGEQPPDSPASLAKVPLAVALLQKTNTENISLDTTIYVEPGNFTEEASSKIQVGQHYPLRTILMQMIDHSSNIAANQLIDYLGSNYINQVLQNRGYRTTRVNYKFTGHEIVPANPGWGKNHLTSNELTKMMVQIYHYEYPGDEVLVQALKHQTDHSLGFTALKGSAAQWLGEKTGHNSKVLGTTLALGISGEQYFITVIDNSGSTPNIRRCIAQIADYLAHQNH